MDALAFALFCLTWLAGAWVLDRLIRQGQARDRSYDTGHQGHGPGEG